jgi:hypothetical protein
MPMSPSPAQSDASRHNGACSAGPATPEGKARSSLNSVRHGLCGRTFFLLPDEDPAEFHEHRRCGSPPGRRATCSSAGRIADEAERAAAMDRAFKALATLLRYRGRIEREYRQAMEALEMLRQRRLARPPATRPNEPEEMPANAVPAAPAPADLAPATSRAALRNEPERPLNRQQRRALAAIERQVQRQAA